MFSLSILQPHRFFGCSFEMEPSEVFAADFFTSVVGSDLANQTFDRFSLQFGDLLTHMFQAVRETCVLARKKENRICARRPTSAIPKAFFAVEPSAIFMVVILAQCGEVLPMRRAKMVQACCLWLDWYSDGVSRAEECNRNGHSELSSRVSLRKGV